MDKSEKIRVAVLYGGRSGEHEVSLVSATNVIQNLDRSRFEVVPIGIDKQGVWFLGDDEKMLRLQRDADRLLFNPNSIGKAVQSFQSKQLLQANPSGRIFDVVFPVIHGPLCEDGTVQGMLELVDVPYVGCGVLSSAIGMDKDVSKRLIKNAGIAVPSFVTLKYGDWQHNAEKWCERIKRQLSFPLFVKPANTGSSVGVEKVKQPEKLFAVINRAFNYDTKIIVEQGIDAIEIEVAVLESLNYGVDPIISLPGEIRPSAAHEFYSYAAKYIDEKGADLIIPAPVPDRLREKIRHAAKEIFLTLECEGMARVDLFLERGTQQIYFNEINTIPGFTQISMYPKLMAASGINYSELLTHLVQLAIDRHARKSKLSREYLPN